MAGGRGVTAVLKILHVDAKRVKGLYCTKGRFSQPGCKRFSGEIVAESPPKFRWITGAGAEIEFFFKDGRMVGSWGGRGRVGYYLIYATSMNRVESPPFPIEELEFPPFPASAVSALHTGNLPESLKLLANKTWEGTWCRSLTGESGSTGRIGLAEYDQEQKMVTVYYSWIYSSKENQTGIRKMRGIFEEGKDLILQDPQGRGDRIVLRLGAHRGKEAIHCVRGEPGPMAYEADFSPVP
jgi:hypothetical protein